MRIIRFEDKYDRIHYGLGEKLDREGFTKSQIELLGGDLYEGMEPTGATANVERLLAPIVPTCILGVGRNYSEHITEAKSDFPEYPVLFMKNNGSLNHPGASILIPKCQMMGPEVDFEGELAVVIGKAARNVNEVEALEYVLGFTIGNDVSARQWQKKGGGGQWCRGKGFDTFCPLGPALVTPDELGDPQRLKIQTRLNGEVMQDSNTSFMIFSVATIISFISQDTTLLPGTVILTGTPSGVGVARDPQVFLKNGDVVEIEIEKIGILKNRVVG